MQSPIEEISELFFHSFKTKPTHIDRLPQSGGDRIYYRVTSAEKTVIATVNGNIKENSTFIYFSKHFSTVGDFVPLIIAVNNDATIYLQSDFGNTSLLDVIEQKGQTLEVLNY